MSAQKKLRAVPSTPDAPTPIRRLPIGAPASRPKPMFGGTKPTPEVSRSLRALLRDHSYTAPRQRLPDHPSRWALFLWTVVIAALLFVGYAATLKQATQSEVKTYPLLRN